MLQFFLHRYPRTEIRDEDWQMEKKAPIPPVDYDTQPVVVTVPVEVWDSGPVLVTNTNNRQASSTYLPGEGKITSTLEEGSKVWKHKTRRRYYEDVKKPPRESSTTSRDSLTRSKKALEYPAKTDEEKLVSTPSDRGLKTKTSSSKYSSSKHHSGYDSKESRKENPIVKYVEDKSTQCNLKKPSKKRFEISQDFRVIKSGKDGSVTAYSDVSNLDDFSNRKKNSTLTKHDDEYIVEKNATLVKHRQATPSPVRRTVVTKTYNLDAGNSLGPDVRPNLSPRLSENRLKAGNDWMYRDRGFVDSYESPRPFNSARETIEETISLSSSDDAVQTHRSTHGSAVKSVIREMDDEKKVISYENPRPRKRDILEESAGNGGSLWFKAPEDDYRRNMAQNDVSFNCIGIKDPEEPPCRIFTPQKTMEKSPMTVLGTQSYTLDRKHLRDRQLGRSSANGIVYRKAPSLPSGNEKNLHRFSSSRDVSARSESGNEGLGYRRGGLAAAYKNRQERASSLNRAIGQQHMRSSTLSLGPSRTTSIHENEPVVMYIPAVSHHRRPADEEDDRLSGIQRSQSILSNRRGVKTSTGVTWASHVKQSEKIEGEGGGQRGRDLKRSQSIPKDTKFPWLSRLKLRSKSKEPQRQ